MTVTEFCELVGLTDEGRAGVFLIAGIMIMADESEGKASVKRA